MAHHTVEWKSPKVQLDVVGDTAVYSGEAPVAQSSAISTGKSQAEVAYSLLLKVAEVEGKFSGSYFKEGADRKYLLDTYAECLNAASGNRTWR